MVIPINPRSIISHGNHYPMWKLHILVRPGRDPPHSSLWLQNTVVQGSVRGALMIQSPGTDLFLARMHFVVTTMLLMTASQARLPVIALCANITCLGPSSRHSITRYQTVLRQALVTVNLHARARSCRTLLDAYMLSRCETVPTLPHEGLICLQSLPDMTTGPRCKQSRQRLQICQGQGCLQGQDLVAGIRECRLRVERTNLTYFQDLQSSKGEMR